MFCLFQKSLKIKSIWILFFSIFLTSFAFAEAEKDEGLIGEVRHSILSPDQFRGLYGNEWILMDGSPIPESDLQKEFGWSHVPDGRGLFLRGKSHGRTDSLRNPYGDLPLGYSEMDLFASHNHNGVTGPDSPDHGHGVDSTGSTCFADGPVPGDRPAATSTCPRPSVTATRASHGPNARHAHAIALEGALETRPKALTVNIFVKINWTKEDKKTKAVLSELKSFPDYLIKDRKFLNLLDAYIKNAIKDGK